jgi:hypothetical protein
MPLGVNVAVPVASVVAVKPSVRIAGDCGVTPNVTVYPAPAGFPLIVKCAVNVTGVSAGEGFALELIVNAVGSAVITTGTAAEVLAVYGTLAPLSGTYTAVSWSVPTASVVDANVATPFDNADVPITVPPLKKFTDPVGATLLAGVIALTVAVIATDVP